jgi:pimeloyl-ACP methyl ester carboxylesterase
MRDGAEERLITGETGAAERQSVGVVIVHGVLPHPRYQIQDDCAANLRDQLEADPNWSGLGTWVVSVLNPRDAAVAQTLEPHPTITRVRLSGDDPVTPARPHFDVIEAYWSPLDKGKATFAGIIAWLLQTVFVPLNTTARYMASRAKTTYDVLFVSAGILGVVLALLGALLATIAALDRLVRIAGNCTPASTPPCPSAWQVVFDPAKLAGVLSPRTIVILALGAVGAYLVTQALKGLLSMLGQHAELVRHSVQRAERWRLIAFVLLIGGALFASSALVPINNGFALGPTAWWFIAAALLLEAGRTLAKSFIVNFFADVEIYTTRDENLDFFGMREKILDVATTTIAHACSDAANGGRGYDRVFVLGHSLGSTIALDALIRFSNLREQAATLDRAFQRLRGFVTFGSPLEKTKYFFDVMNPSPSAGLEQWRNDAYGVLFTADAAQLEPNDNAAAKGIFWGNYWYFKDAIANELCSYRSFLPPKASIAQGHHLRRLLRESLTAANVPPGHAVVGRLVCRNERGHKGFIFPAILPHGEYLGDPWFWRTDPATMHLGVLDVVARWRGRTVAAAAPAGTTAFAAAPPSRGPGGATFETLPAGEADRYADRYPPLPAQPGKPDENAP